MIRNNLSWINLNAGSSGGSGGGGVSDYNDLANRPIISMTGTSQNPLKLWNLSTGLYLLNGYVYYNTTNTRECVNLFVSITAQIQNGKYVLSAFVPSWEGHYEYIKANSTSTEYTDTQILKMLTEDDVLTLTNEVEYTPTTDYHPSTKKYVDEAMQSVMEEFAKMGVNEQDIKTLIAENRRRDIAIQALLNETADKNVTIEEDTHTISLDYSMEDGMATVNSIEGSTLVNVSKTVDEVYVTKGQDRVEQTKVANTIGEQNGKLCPIIEGDTLVNVCDQKDPIAITKSYTVENSGNHIALQGEYDGKCRPVIQGNTLVNLFNISDIYESHGMRIDNNTITLTEENDWAFFGSRIPTLKPSTLYTFVVNVIENTTNNNIYINNVGEGVTYFPEIPWKAVTEVGTHIYTATTASDLTDLRYSVRTDAKGTGYAKLQIMLFEGDLTQTPELIPTEYVEGLKNSFENNVVTQAMVDSGEESAENLGKYKVEYKVTGKNKFDFRIWNDVKLSNPSAGTLVISNNSLTLRKEVTGDFYVVSGATGSEICNQIERKYLIECKPDTAYTISYVRDNNILGSSWVMLYDKNYNRIAMNTTISNATTYSFTTPNNAKYIGIRFGISEIVTGTVTYSNIQLEEGIVATEYEPYKSYTKTFYLNSPLLEGDTIEDINGVATHVKRYGKVVLDGSSDEDWTHDYKAENTSRFYFGLSDRPNINKNFYAICDNFSYVLYGYDIDEELMLTGWGGIYIRLNHTRLAVINASGFKQWLSENPTTVVYELASPIYEPISTESILCDSYVNGHLDFDSAVPVERVKFNTWNTELKYLNPSTSYKIKFVADNYGKVDWFNMATATLVPLDVVKGTNEVIITTSATIADTMFGIYGIGFNASNIVVTEAVDKDFDYFNRIQSTFEENLVTDENNPHYGKYRVIYRTKSSDGNASTVKSVYLNSPLLQGDKLVVVNGKLCHYHKMGKVVLDGSEKWTDLTYTGTNVFCYEISKGCPSDFKDGGKLYSDTKSRGGERPWIGEVGLAFCRASQQGLYAGFATADEGRAWIKNPTTVVYELASPYYEEISSNPKDTVVDFYANGTLEVQSAVYPLSMEFTSFEEELTYLYASTVYTVQFEANGNAIANITLGGTTVTNQEITHGLNKIQVTTPSTLIDNKLIIDGCGDCKISKVVVTNSTEEFEYFEGMKSAFEDKQNEDGTYTVEIVVYNAPIRLNKDKE